VPATVADLVALLDLTPDGEDRYLGRQPVSHLQRVFGGQAAAQTLTAATDSLADGLGVERELSVHSLHA